MSKRIIICADGTWNQVERYEKGSPVPVSTNVAKLASALGPKAPNGEDQVLFYMEGVGTAVDEGFEGGAFGFGLSNNILRAYSYLVSCYDPGDRLYFFGFSRGAFTVRSLAGMLRTCGILRRDAAVSPAIAMELYADRRSEKDPDLMRCRVFRRMHSHESFDIECIGVWDTVGSLGIPSLTPGLAKWLEIGWHFHDVRLGAHVRNAFHALAIHERRSTFPPTLWELEPGATGQNLVQCWFPGVHSDVGGGYPCQGEESSPLSDVPLKWMIEMTGGKLADEGGLSGGAELGYYPDWALCAGCDPHADGKASRHESWSGVLKFIDLLRLKTNGSLRTFKSARGTGVQTNESLHSSAKIHFDRHGAKGWPPGFIQ